MLGLVGTVLAQEINLTPQESSEFVDLQNITFPSVIQAGLTLVLVVAAIVFFFMLVIGGIRWILSGGDKQQTENARNQVTAAIVGLVIVFAAWAIAQLLGTFFGVEIFSVTIPNAVQ